MTSKPETTPPKSGGARIHVDIFENHVLQKRDHGDPEKVLAALRAHPAVSCFEGTNTLMQTIAGLKEEGRIRQIPSGYPWWRYEVCQ